MNDSQRIIVKDVKVKLEILERYAFRNSASLTLS